MNNIRDITIVIPHATVGFNSKLGVILWNMAVNTNRNPTNMNSYQINVAKYLVV